MKKPKSCPPPEDDPLAGENAGLISEFFAFARAHKKLWLVPIFLILLVFGALILLGGSSAAPFIYRLF